jgi:metal-sulfur cluster biosynthetic enzyme
MDEYVRRATMSQAESAAEDKDATVSAETEKVIGEIYEALHNVYDTELGINIVDLGLVYNVDLREDGFVTITMTLTTPGCPMHESIGEGVGAALQPIGGVTGGTIQLVWEPRWEPAMMTEAGRAELGYW